MQQYYFGHIKDPKDSRDYVFSAPAAIEDVKKPAVFSLNDKINLTYDQGPMNSCVGNGTALLFYYLRQKEGLPIFNPSRLFIYWNARAMRGTTGQDQGCVIRDAIKSVNTLGVCSEDDWKYDKNLVFKKPDTNSYNQALLNQSIEYTKIPRDLEQIKNCLYEGYPFVLGFRVPKSFTSSQTRNTGIVETPLSNESLDNGHAVLIIGWNDDKKLLQFRNSYGPKWGDKGNGYLRYAAIENEKWSSDYWTIRTVEDGSLDCGCGTCPGC